MYRAANVYHQRSGQRLPLPQEAWQRRTRLTERKMALAAAVHVVAAGSLPGCDAEVDNT